MPSESDANVAIQLSKQHALGRSDNLTSSNRSTLPDNLPAALSPALAAILDSVRRELSNTESPTLGDSSPHRSYRFRHDTIRISATRLGFELSNFEIEQIIAHLEREARPFGILQPLVDDKEVSDIIVYDHSKISIQRGRRCFITSLRFSSPTAYESFVEKLLLKAGTTYSTKQPIADGMIGALARIHAVHRSVCDTGPYLTIRLNRYSEVSCADLLETGFAPKPLLDYLSAIIRSGKTILIVGEVGTGKTTLARALAATIPQAESILVIEDTPEIRLEHPHVRYLRTREENLEGAGELSPTECIRAGMRMAMNRIVFGEIRDAQAAEAFIDVCASGHPGLSTIHGRSSLDAVTRLELFLGRAQPGVLRSTIQEQIATSVQVIVYVQWCSVTGARRIVDVREIGPVADGVMRQRCIFEYDILSNAPLWRVVTKSSAYRQAIEPIINLASLPSHLGLERADLPTQSFSPSRSTITKGERRLW